MEFRIFEEDFLAFQLFAASRSEMINLKKRKNWIILTGGSALAAIYFYFEGKDTLAIYFGIISVLSGLFYPAYFRWRYKRHYKTFIRENYSKRFGESEHLEITADTIFAKDKTSESNIFIKEIEKIDETARHFFVKISTGITLIIPKKEIKNTEELKAKFYSLGLIVNDLTNWAWK